MSKCYYSVVTFAIIIIILPDANCAVGPKYCSKLKSIVNWNDHRFVNFTLSAQTINNTIFYNATIDVKEDVPQCYISIEGYMESRGRKLRVINESLDLCGLLSGKEMNILAFLVLKPFRQLKTMPHDCPIEKGFYYAENLLFDTSQYPTLLPKATFTAKIMFKIRKQSKLLIIYRGTVIGYAKRVPRRQSC